MSKVYCIIPARSGSKRIKNKNILNFYGTPLIGRTIKTARNSKIFDKVIVSSDSRKIINIAKKYGAINYGLREEKFSGDRVTTDQLIFREINRCKLQKIDILCCIYPATPLLKSKMLIEGFKKFKKENYNSLISVAKYEYPIFRALKINKKKINFIWNKYQNKRSQEIKDTVHDVGYFYFFKTNKFLKEKKIINKNTGFYEIPRDQAIDIDEYIDLKIAKKLYKK